MDKQAVVALGLPGSGKTTFLAALWHLITAMKVHARLKLVRLEAGEASYLKEITARWLQAKRQERTFHSGNRTVTLKLGTGTDREFDFAFPDIAGEAFARMWEARECDTAIAEALEAPAVMLFIHADKIKAPGWIADDVAQSQDIGIARTVGEQTNWQPQFAPTQVQLVDLLRCLQENPLDVGQRKLAIVLSAWDQVEAEQAPPDEFLKLHLPLLHQYIEHGLSDSWAVCVFGVSAQGAEYDDVDSEPSADAQRMREMDIPSMRIKVVVGGTTSHDLTEPLFWLLEQN
jgi:hypothetical protein